MSAGRQAAGRWRAVSAIRALLCLAAVHLSAGKLSADDVYLIDGRVYENVKTTPGRDGHFLIFEDGRTILVRERDIMRIEIGDVDWERREPDPGPDLQLPVGGFPSLWRSTLLPGWGQVRNNHQYRGGLFLASMMMFGYQYQKTLSGWNAARADLTQARSLAFLSYTNVSLTLPLSLYAADLGQQARQRSRTAANQLDWIAVLAGALYIWNVFDAYHAPGTADLPGITPDRSAFRVELDGFVDASPSPASVGASAYAERGSGMRLGFRWRF